MNTVAVIPEPKAEDVQVTDEEICVHLVDGRRISVPLVWSWRLCTATPEQRNRFELIGDGTIIHWPEVDEDISVESLLWGTPAPRPRAASPAIDFLHGGDVGGANHDVDVRE